MANFGVLVYVARNLCMEDFSFSFFVLFLEPWMTYEYNHKVDKLSVFLHLKLFFPGPSLEQNLRTLSVYIYTAAPRSDGQKMKTKTLEWWGRSSEDILVCCG